MEIKLTSGYVDELNIKVNKKFVVFRASVDRTGAEFKILKEDLRRLIG